MRLLFWAPLFAVSAHIVEEFVFPGGFLAWHRRYRPEHAASITPRFAVVVNGLLLFLCVAVGINGPIPLGVVQWLILAAILVTNAAFHIRAVASTRTYSPGVVTAACLYVPLGVAGTYRLLKTGTASIGIAAAAFLIGGSYPIVSAVLHRLRSRRRRTDRPPG